MQASGCRHLDARSAHGTVTLNGFHPLPSTAGTTFRPATPPGWEGEGARQRQPREDPGRITAKVGDDHRIQTLPNGRCIQILPSGNTFEGDYRDDKKHGRGIYTWASGAR
jgi:hypothetical protein